MGCVLGGARRDVRCEMDNYEHTLLSLQKHRKATAPKPVRHADIQARRDIKTLYGDTALRELSSW